MPTLKDGSLTEDPRLDRLVEFDERSRNFSVRAAGVVARPRSYTWRINSSYDQGREGSCVGFAVTHEIVARPAEVTFPSDREATNFAKRDVYWEAQKIDPWPGGSYPGAEPHYEGTSVLAGLKVAKRLGYFSEYRWAFTLQDLLYGLGHNGPAVLGINWYYDMYFPDEKGFIKKGGAHVGGHAILARAIKVRWQESALSKPWRSRTHNDLDQNKSVVTLRNSWGTDWGRGGDCYMTVRDLEEIRAEQGEAAFARMRTTQV